MSNVGVHSFQIPHEFVQPVRDMIIVRLPAPPRKSKGGIITPDVTRDLMAHNVMAGLIYAAGPIALQYKDGTGSWKAHEFKIGDWVLFRPFAGTMIQGGTIKIMSGWRYMSSFNDVIGIIKADHMPNADSLDWDYGDDAEPGNAVPDDFKFDSRKVTPLKLDGA